MSSPYQPEPGCTAMQRQLEQQVHDLRQQLRAAEDELGPLRQRVDAFQLGAIEREALLADARDLLEPWGGHGDDWPAIAPAITVLIGKLNEALERAQAAEAQVDERGADSGDWMSGMLWARKLAFWSVEPPVSSAFTQDKPQPVVNVNEAEPVTLTARHLSYQRPACPGCGWAAHAPLTCDEVREFRSKWDGYLNGQVEMLRDQSVKRERTFELMYGKLLALVAKEPEGECPPACAEGHRYEGDCLLDPLDPGGIGSITYLGTGRGLWAWSCEGHEWCEGVSGSDHETGFGARRAHDRHVKRWHTQDEP